MKAKIIKYNNKDYTITELSALLGMPRDRLFWRLRQPWLSDKVFSPGKQHKGQPFKRTIPVKEHIAVAEKALGKPLPTGAIVHHVDEDPTNNSRGNLVICQGNGYHSLLHRRRAALLEYGSTKALKCGFCSQWDDPLNLRVVIRGTVTYARHKSCEYLYNINYKKGVRLSKKGKYDGK